MENLKTELQEKIKKMQDVHDAASTSVEMKAMISKGLDNAKLKLKALEDAEKRVDTAEEDKKKADQEVTLTKARIASQKKEAKTPAKKKEIEKKIDPVLEKARAAQQALKTAKEEVIPAKNGAKKSVQSLKSLVATKPELSKLYANTPEKDLIRDAARRALSPGKRTSTSGKVYYEKRADRVDVTHKKYPLLAKGGEVNYEYAVSVDYQDKKGEPQTRRVRVTSESEDAAIDKAILIVRQNHNPIKIVGGVVTAGGLPQYSGSKVYIGFYRKRFVVVSATDPAKNELWANEYFKTLEKAKEFIEENNFDLISETVVTYDKKTMEQTADSKPVFTSPDSSTTKNSKLEKGGKVTEDNRLTEDNQTVMVHFGFEDNENVAVELQKVKELVTHEFELIAIKYVPSNGTDSDHWDAQYISKVKTVKTAAQIEDEIENELTEFGSVSFIDIQSDVDGVQDSEPERELLLDENRGIYIPKAFYDTMDFAKFGLKKENFVELSDPENEFYWDAWQDLLSDAITAEGDTLEHDGDLWLVKASKQMAGGGPVDKESQGGKLTYKDGTQVPYDVLYEQGKDKYVIVNQYGLPLNTNLVFRYANRQNKFDDASDAQEALRKLLIGLHEEIPQHNPPPSFYKNNKPRRLLFGFLEKGGQLNFKEAVNAKEPNDLGAWHKDQPADERRTHALRSRSLGSDHDRYMSAARALQALANVTTDADTKKVAKSDAAYFFGKASKFKRGANSNALDLGKLVIEYKNWHGNDSDKYYGKQLNVKEFLENNHEDHKHLLKPLMQAIGTAKLEKARAAMNKK